MKTAFKSEARGFRHHSQVHWQYYDYVCYRLKRKRCLLIFSLCIQKVLAVFYIVWIENVVPSKKDIEKRREKKKIKWTQKKKKISSFETTVWRLNRRQVNTKRQIILKSWFRIILKIFLEGTCEPIGNKKKSVF